MKICSNFAHYKADISSGLLDVCITFSQISRLVFIYKGDKTSLNLPRFSSVSPWSLASVKLQHIAKDRLAALSHIP